MSSTTNNSKTDHLNDDDDEFDLGSSVSTLDLGEFISNQQSNFAIFSSSANNNNNSQRSSTTPRNPSSYSRQNSQSGTTSRSATREENVDDEKNIIYKKSPGS